MSIGRRHEARGQRWIVAAVFVAISVINFVRIDGESRSASDTLIDFIPQTIVLFLFFAALFLFLTKKSPERAAQTVRPWWDQGWVKIVSFLAALLTITGNIAKILTSLL